MDLASFALDELGALGVKNSRVSAGLVDKAPVARSRKRWIRGIREIRGNKGDVRWIKNAMCDGSINAIDPRDPHESVFIRVH